MLFSTRLMRLARETYRHRAEYAYVLPALLLTTAVILFPALQSLYLSLFRTERVGLRQDFAWFSNYADLLTSREFYEVLHHTLVWAFGSVAFQFLLGLAMATLLNTPLRGQGVITAALTFPWISSYVVSALIWQWMYHGELGVVNDLLRRLGLMRTPIAWLAHPSLAMPAVITTNVWKLYPFMMIMLLAGLKGVPEELYEAAKIDGAGSWQRFTHISLPQLLPVMAVVTLLGTVWAFNAFVLVYTMTGGGPADLTTIFGLMVYRLSFIAFDFGKGAAASWLLFLVLLPLSAMYVASVARRSEF